MVRTFKQHVNENKHTHYKRVDVIANVKTFENTLKNAKRTINNLIEMYNSAEEPADIFDNDEIVTNKAIFSLVKLYAEKFMSDGEGIDGFIAELKKYK